MPWTITKKPSSWTLKILPSWPIKLVSSSIVKSTIRDDFTVFLFSAVYFEQEKYDECIRVCEKAVEIGRENRADYQSISK